MFFSGRSGLVLDVFNEVEEAPINGESKPIYSNYHSGNLTPSDYLEKTGDGSSLTNVNAATVGGVNKDGFINRKFDVSANANTVTHSFAVGITSFANSLGSTGYPNQYGGAVHFTNDAQPYRNFTLWTGNGGLYWRGFNTGGGDLGFKKIYHEGNFTPPVIDNVLKLTPRTQPSSPTKGMVYYDSGTDLIRYYNGTIWVNL